MALSITMFREYAERFPGRAMLTGPQEMDHGFAMGMALTIRSPSGRTYRSAMRARWRPALMANELANVADVLADALATKYRRKLKRWLRS